MNIQHLTPIIQRIACILVFMIVSGTGKAQPTPLHTDSVLTIAFRNAKAANKQVFVIFHASWCSWCRKMDAAMNDSACKPFFDAHYIIVHLTILESKDKKHLENQGAEQLFREYAPPDSGIPFWMIYGANGQVLTNATMPDGTNAGCPATQKEVEHLMTALQRSAGMDEKTKRAIFRRFRENEPVKQ